jgi:uncharacterized pyridoxal phosphate-containing UPF0001 family protein
MSIAETFYKNNLPEHVALVAVSKTKPISDLMEAYDASTYFGENKIQWRINGNRCQKILVAHDWSCPDKQGQIHGSFVNLIHGVDSFKLLKEINRL